MKNSIKTAVLGLAALVSGFSACNDADYDTLGVHAFVSESASNKSTKVTITELGADAEITACLSEAATKDVKLKFVVDSEVLDRYNQKQASSFLVLPEEIYEMDSEVTIKAGEFSAPATKIHIKPLPKEYVGESYALPLRLVSADGSVPVTSVTSTYVITTEAIVVSSLPMFVGGAGLAADGFPLTLPQFTVEVRFQVSNTANRNRAVFTNGGSVLLRFEDPQNDTSDHKAHSLVQFQGDGWYLNPSLSFTPNKWQHLALTYDQGDPLCQRHFCRKQGGRVRSQLRIGQLVRRRCRRRTRNRRFVVERMQDTDVRGAYLVGMPYGSAGAEQHDHDQRQIAGLGGLLALQRRRGQYVRGLHGQRAYAEDVQDPDVGCRHQVHRYGNAVALIP